MNATEPAVPATSQPGAVFRWLVLVFVSLAMFGNYYVYDCISPMADVLVRDLGFSDGDIGWLQAIYSIPNIVMVLIGGIIIDRIGTKRSILLFAVICLIGSVVTLMRGDLTSMAARPADLRPGRRVADRRRDDGDRAMVHRPRAGLRVRREPDDRPSRVVRGLELSHLGARCVFVLAWTTGDQCRVRGGGRGGRARLLVAGGRGRTPACPRPGRAHRQGGLRRPV